MVEFKCCSSINFAVTLKSSFPVLCKWKKIKLFNRWSFLCLVFRNTLFHSQGSQCEKTISIYNYEEITSLLFERATICLSNLPFYDKVLDTTNQNIVVFFLTISVSSGQM